MLFFIILLFFYISSSTYVNISIVEQLAYDINFFLRCQNMNDANVPYIIEATDDFEIPPNSYFTERFVKNGIDDCQTIVFNFLIRRSKKDMDPSSIVINLYTNDIING